MDGYTVYKHTTPSNKVYIGITKQNAKQRWCNGKGYNHSPHFLLAIKKYGWNNILHEVLFEGLTKEEAEAKERDLISEYRATDRRFGYNCDTGGNVNKSHSEETRKKMSESQKGHKMGENARKLQSERMKGTAFAAGHKVSEEARKRISEKHKGLAAGEKNYFYGKHFIGEKHPHAIAVDKLTLDGKFLESRNCAKDFSDEFGAVNASHIIDVCRGKRKSAFGFKWRYKEEDNRGMV